MNTDKIREDFPLTKKCVYFDNAATTLTPKPVLDAVNQYYSDYRANIHRGAHFLTKKASEEYELTYEKLAKLYNAGSSEFSHTKNATEAINLVALGMEWRKNASVVATNIEHHSNLLPWVRLEKLGLIKLKIVEASKDAEFDLNDFQNAIDSSTQLVAVTSASNVLGNKTPVEEITKLARDNGSLSLIDAAQAAGHMKMDFRKINADFIAFSGHKMLGPTGTGVLYKKTGVELDSALVGGGTISDASLHDYVLLENREALEAGTPNIGGVIGLGAAVDYLSKIGLDNVFEHDKKIVKKIMKGFAENPKIDFYGPKKIEDKTSVVSFNVKESDSHQTALLCDSLGKICVRSGHHCAIPVTKLLGVKATARASVYVYNTESEADKFIDVVNQITKLS